MLLESTVFDSAAHDQYTRSSSMTRTPRQRPTNSSSKPPSPSTLKQLLRLLLAIILAAFTLLRWLRGRSAPASTRSPASTQPGTIARLFH